MPVDPLNQLSERPLAGDRLATSRVDAGQRASAASSAGMRSGIGQRLTAEGHPCLAKPGKAEFEKATAERMQAARGRSFLKDSA
jgi:hypothetical protein